MPEGAGGVRPSDLEKFLDNLKEKLGARSAMVKLDFPYFVTKKAPVSGIESYLDVECHSGRKRRKIRPGPGRGCARAHPVPLLQGNQQIRRPQPAGLGQNDGPEPKPIWN